MTKKLITVGIPTGEYFTVCRDFHNSLVHAICHCYAAGIDVYPIHTASPKTADNRNAIVAGMKGSHVFMVDADMTFEKDTIERMLAVSDAYPDAVITGLGFMGFAPFYPALFRWNHDQLTATPVGKWPEKSVFEIDLCGSFGLLVPKHILDKVGPGAFNHIFAENKDGKTSREIRHDFAFCLRVREAGFSIICDPTIKFGHIRPYPINELDWFAHRERMEMEKLAPSTATQIETAGNFDQKQ